MTYPLGRLHAPDARDQLHMMAVPPLVGPLPYYRYWTPGPVLDQGQTPSCVGHAWKQWLATSPVRHGDDALSAIDIYHEAQLVDEFPGEDYEGTSVRAGAKVMLAHKRLAEYVWAQSVEDIARWVLTQGPVVLGTNWYSDMFHPVEGIVHVGGSVEGGHAYACVGYNSVVKIFRCVNSWGRDWGEHGRFWLGHDDVARLLSEQGEAATAAELA